jgi:hypothetical protein
MSAIAPARTRAPASVDLSSREPTYLEVRGAGYIAHDFYSCFVG